MWFERATLSRHHERRQAPFERRGRGPASFYRPRLGQWVGVGAATRAYRTRPVDCLAGLIPGVLALYPQSGDGSRTRLRSLFPSAGPEGVALGPQEPVYVWLLPSSACARAAVNQETVQGVKTGRRTVEVDEDGRSSPPCRSPRSRLREGTLRPAPLPLNGRPVQSAIPLRRPAPTARKHTLPDTSG